jgi:DNA-binding transcriptional LysR family regulator
MTFEQLSIFVAVAEREHLTRGAAAVGLTPSAVSSAIKALESYYRVHLFHRIGRRIELTQAGRVFLEEARSTLSRVQAAERTLSELGGLQRGSLDIFASQTIASYWLPAVLMRFRATYPGIEIRLKVGNTRDVVQALTESRAEAGFIEGLVDEPALVAHKVATDALHMVVAPSHPLASRDNLSVRDLEAGTDWVMREPGSGTRSEFEAAVRAAGGNPSRLTVALELPSNEAVLSAVVSGPCAAVVSRLAASPLVAQGRLVVAKFALPPRSFQLVHHRERYRSGAFRALAGLCGVPPTV